MRASRNSILGASDIQPAAALTHSREHSGSGKPRRGYLDVSFPSSASKLLADSPPHRMRCWNRRHGPMHAATMELLPWWGLVVPLHGSDGYDVGAFLPFVSVPDMAWRSALTR